IEEEFRSIIGNRIEKITEVEYVYQDINDLPEGYTCPADRTKPWGTGHAVLAAKKVITEPFIVINADDYYGKEAFVKIHDYLVEEKPAAEKMDICMAGFILENTLSDNGGVTRGVCALDENKKLVGITETYNIQKTPEGPAAVDEETGAKTPLGSQTLVSMNMWGLTPEFLEVLEKGFVNFLAGVKPGEIKKEYLLPAVVDQLIQENKAEVAVLKTHDTWFGVTYQEDKEKVMESFKELVKKGVYKEQLFS
ncbi:MAG TPA: nucleotidyltransferase, partial [Candidatus Blautia stercoravium]|nr:nucleotidyltransferase [Candidatus Blautia stercoravium]